mmetsp:Transcript_20649/g.41778  ORF Transcript_20649/g.41778 Transcript_20649/m.41778 type:complete len:91 (-) Transcript_20649:272-544(-)
MPSTNGKDDEGASRVTMTSVVRLAQPPRLLQDTVSIPSCRLVGSDRYGFGGARQRRGRGGVGKGGRKRRRRDWKKREEKERKKDGESVRE